MNCPSCNQPADPSMPFCRACGAPLEATAPDPLIGTTIGGKYRVIKRLGEGGMGCVYHGEQQLGTNTRRVAIKTLHAELSRDPKVLARFDRECGTMTKLEHPNTIQVYDFGKTDSGQLYIVMEFIQGENLADTLEKGGAFTPERATHVLRQVCGSLAEAHGLGIVHRDLKPENIVLTERAGQKDFVKVLDFGIAKRSGEEDKNEQKLTQQGMVLGTPPYMSPEQFTGKPIDVRSDIYSLGIMAYEMLTGRLPFSGNTAWEWATAHMTANPMAIEVHPSGMRAPDAMRRAVMKALGKRAEQRFETVNEFFSAFIGEGPAGTAVIASAVGSALPGTESMQTMDPNGAAVRSGTVAAMPASAMPMSPTGPVPTTLPSAAGYPAGYTAPGNYTTGPQQAYGPPPGQQPGYGPTPSGYGPPPGAPPGPGMPASGQPQGYGPQAGGYGPAAPGWQPPPQTQKKGGGGALVVVGLLGLLLLLGGGGATAYFVLSGDDDKKANSEKDAGTPPPPPPPVVEDAGIATDTDAEVDAGVPSLDTDGGIASLDSGRPPAPTGVTPPIGLPKPDAGIPFVPPPPPPPPRQPAECSQASGATSYAVCQSLAMRCQALGGRPPSCNHLRRPAPPPPRRY